MPDPCKDPKKGHAHCTWAQLCAIEEDPLLWRRTRLGQKMGSMSYKGSVQKVCFHEFISTDVVVEAAAPML